MMIEELEYYRKLLLRANREIRILTKSEAYAEAYNRLIAIPGIGMITAMTILTEAVTPDRFTGLRRFISYLDSFLPWMILARTRMLAR